MKMLTIIVTVAMGMLMTSNALAKNQSPQKKTNCLITAVQADGNGGHQFFFKCNGGAESLGFSKKDAVNEVLLHAAQQGRLVTLHLAKTKYGNTIKFVEIRYSLHVETTNKSSKKERTNCRVVRVDAASHFRRCWVSGCKKKKGQLKLEDTSDNVFQMCMAAAMSKKRVKITYLQGKKSAPHLLTYIRYTSK